MRCKGGVKGLQVEMQILSTILIVFAAMCMGTEAGRYLYRLSPKKLSLKAARDYCEKHGGWLAYMDQENLRDANRKLQKDGAGTAWIGKFKKGHKHSHYMVSEHRKGLAHIVKVSNKKKAYALCQKKNDHYLEYLETRRSRKTRREPSF